MKLTARAVARLSHEGPLPFRDVKDEGTPGLYLRGSCIAKWMAEPTVGTFGDAARLGLAGARAKASSWHAVVRAGRDPAPKSGAKLLPSAGAFSREYIERHAKPNKRSWREMSGCSRRAASHRIDTVVR